VFIEEGWSSVAIVDRPMPIQVWLVRWLADQFADCQRQTPGEWLAASAATWIPPKKSMPFGGVLPLATVYVHIHLIGIMLMALRERGCR
jgi:hypothetical protein